MKIGITGNRGDLCLRLADNISEAFGTEVEKISLFGDGWKSRTFDYDVLIHIAGVVPRSGVKAEDYYQVNRDLTDAVAKKAYNDGTKHLIYFSTMAVYGVVPSVGDGGLVTDDTPLHPDTDYGKSKLAGEEAIRKYECDWFHATYLRIPSVYFVGNTLFLQVAEEMYSRFKRHYPKLYEKHGRGAICVENLCELVKLTIERQYYGIVCPQDAPPCSLFDYMTILNEVRGDPKKPSILLGLLVKGIMVLKPSWKLIFGRVVYSDTLSACMNGDYRVVDSTAALKECLTANKYKDKGKLI